MKPRNIVACLCFPLSIVMAVAFAAEDGSSPGGEKEGPRLLTVIQKDREWVLEKLEAAEIEEFKGQPGVVRVLWTGRSAPKGAGFNVMRGRAEAGPFERVNETLLPARDHFQYLDFNVKIGEVHYYYVEYIDPAGQSERATPILETAVTRRVAGPGVFHARRGEPQLFVDDLLIQSSQDLRRTLHQPTKDDGGNVPLLALEDEFGGTPGTNQANGSIVYDPKLKKYVMYAIICALGKPLNEWDRVRIYRYTSPDAMNWVKGDDGTPQLVYPIEESDAHDPEAEGGNIDLFSCYYDETDAERPYKGWLYVFERFPSITENQGLYYMSSADGVRWERGPLLTRGILHQITQDGKTVMGPGDVTTLYKDPLADRFLTVYKFFAFKPLENTNLLRSRAYMFLDRLDEPFDVRQIERIALLPPGEATNGDQPLDEYYSSTMWRYGSHWLGGLKIWHREDDYPYSAAGCAFLKLVSSPDGLDWKKVQFENEEGVPEVWIANGEEGGNGGRNDGGYMTEFSQGPLRIGDELIYYYGSSSWGKKHDPGIRITGGGVFRARLRPDGFVSVDGGTLTTHPFDFEGNGLVVNAVGPVKVDLLDGQGTEIGSARVEGDSLRHAVKFGGKAIDEARGEGLARLRFTVEPGGKLYAFAVE